MVQNFDSLQLIYKEKLSNLKVFARSKYNKLQFLVKISEALSIGDEILHFVKSKQKWDMIPIVSLIGIIYPSIYAKRFRAISLKKSYPKFLHPRTLPAMHNARGHLLLNQKMSTDQVLVQLEYLLLFKTFILAPLLSMKAVAFLQTVGAFHVYRMTRKSTQLIEKIEPKENLKIFEQILR